MTIADTEFPRLPSSSLPPATDSTLGRIFTSGLDASLAPTPGSFEEPPSAFAPLNRSDEAFDLRLALLSAAESSIDLQVYLWHEDSAGSLLLDRMLEAADRGVRVRLLIDDFKLEGNEDLDAALDLHPLLELRVFNPTLHRSGFWRSVELVENLGRFDHRMHNKLMVVDGVAAVFGGRNVGDEYFGLGTSRDFRDYDLLATGAVVEGLAETFDEFWNSDWTVPLSAFHHSSGGEEQHTRAHAAARETLVSLHAEDARLDGRRARRPSEWRTTLEGARARLVPARAHVLHDSADVARVGATGVFAKAFEDALRDYSGDVLVATAYFVPDDELLQRLREHVASGGRVQVLTNSRASTNQPLAHHYYARSRRDLLEAGVELYELRADAWDHVLHRSPGSTAQALGLHAKCAVLGPEHLIVGSMNLDPRSMRLNTEFGVLIESRTLTELVRADLARGLAPRNAWRVTLSSDGVLQWESQGVVLDEDPVPESSLGAREWFLTLLPLRGEV